MLLVLPKHPVSQTVVLPVFAVALQVKKVKREAPVDWYAGRNPFQEHQSKRMEKVHTYICIRTNPQGGHHLLVL